MLSVLVDAAAVVQFNRGALGGLVVQRSLVVASAVGVLHSAIAQLFVLGWVVGDAAVCALKSSHSHEMGLEGDGGCPDQ